MLVHFLVMFFIIFTMNILYFYVYHLPLKAAILQEEDDTVFTESETPSESSESEEDLPPPENYKSFEKVMEDFTNQYQRETQFSL